MTLRLKWALSVMVLVWCSIVHPSADNTVSDTGNRTHSEWELLEDKSGIQVYSKPVVGSPINEIRAETIVESSLNRLVSILYDPDLRPLWDEMCGESYFYERLSDTEYLAYIHTRLPWPIEDRDILARVVWSQDPVSLKVLKQSTATEDILAKHKGRVRVTTATDNWELQPLGNGRIRITFAVHADPAGPIPAWLINRLSRESPYKMLLSISKVIENRRVEHQEFAFIQEPKKS